MGARISAVGTLLDINSIPICTKTNTQWFPAVAANGTNYLVVWEEFNLLGDDIYGARISPEGILLDTNALTICTATNTQASPSVAANEGGFLVAWQDFRNGNSRTYESDIYATRMDGNGVVLDTNGIAVATASNNQCHPAVVSVNSGYQIAWQDSRNNEATMLSDIYSVKLNLLGQINDSHEIKIGSAPNYQTTPAIASNGTNCLVVWTDYRNGTDSGTDIYGVRLDAAGQVIGTTGIPICRTQGNQTAPAVASLGGEFLVVWADQRNNGGTNTDIYGTRIDANGSVLDTNGIVVCNAPYDQYYPALAAKGDRYLVAWQDARASATNAVRWDIYAARLDRAGTVLDPNGILVTGTTGDQALPAVAANQTQWLVAWEDRRAASNVNIYGARIDDGGVLLDTNGIAICTAPQNQTTPVLVSNGTDFLAAWTDARNSSTAPDIYAARITGDGILLDLNGIPIRQIANQQLAPALATYGSNYFIAWQEAGLSVSNNFNIAGISLGLDGVVATNSLIYMNTNICDQTSPALVFSQGKLLLVSQGFQFGGARTVANQALLSPRLISLQQQPGNFQFMLTGPPRSTVFY